MKHPVLSEVTVVALVVVLAVGLPALAALWLHTFSVPRNDAWAYERVLFYFARTGHFRLVGWGAMTLVGQVLWAAPFVVLLGPKPWVPGLAVAVLAAIGLIAAYSTARSVGGRRSATWVVLTVVALPGFLLNTSTFMSDVPALAADAACLALGTVALERPGQRWVWTPASMAVGIFGFSVREFDIVAPLAVLIVLAATDRRQVARYGAAGLCVMAACAGIYIWTAALPGAQHKSLGLPTGTTWHLLGAAYFTLAFCLTPWLPGALRRSRARLGPRSLVAGVAVLAVGALLMIDHQPVFLGNDLTQTGVTGLDVLLGARPALFPSPLWALMELVALAGGVALALVVVSSAGGAFGQPRRPATVWATAPIVRVFVVLNVALLVGYALLVRAAVWDRYLWPLAFGVSVLLGTQGTRQTMRPARARGQRASPWSWRAPPVALALALASVSVALTLNSDAYDAARWRAGKEAVRAGIAAKTVDAGFEWVGTHATTMALPGRQVPNAPIYDTWYDQMFPNFKECAFVSGSPVGGVYVVLLRALTYNELAFGASEHLYLYAVRSPSCSSTAGRR